MNRPPRPGGRTLAGCVALVAALFAFVFVPGSSAAQSRPGSDYLALGDSLAYGYQAAKFAGEFPNVIPESFNGGYVNRLSFWLQLRNPTIKTTNDGCPGESTDSFIHGGRGPLTGFNFVPNPGFCGDQPAPGIGAIFSKAWLHHFYAGSQLADALAFLAAHPDTNPITVDLGANDALIFLEKCGFGAVPNCITPQSVAAAYAHIGANMTTILGALRAAAPDAEIVVLGLYNAYPTVLPGGDQTTRTLNGVLRTAAMSAGARFADPLGVFNPSAYTGAPEATDIPVICALTNMCPGGIFNPASPAADIHPTNAGYSELARRIAFALTPVFG
jgi:lysophospholipase L1-like esterase